MKEKGTYSLQKTKGRGKIVTGVILLVLGAVIFQFLIPMITVTPTQYREEFDSAEVGTTWTIHGHLADKNSTDLAGQMIYFYTFEEDRNAQISSTSDLGENGDEVIVEVEKTNAGLKFAETRSRTSPWLYRGAGGVLAVIGVILLIVGSVQFSRTRTKKKHSEESHVNQVDLSQLIGQADTGMGPPSNLPFQTPPMQPQGPPAQQFQQPRPSPQMPSLQTQMPGQSMQAPQQQPPVLPTPQPTQPPPQPATGQQTAAPTPSLARTPPGSAPSQPPAYQTTAPPTIPQTPPQPTNQPPQPITQPAQQQHPAPESQTAAQPTIMPGTALSGFQPPSRPPAAAPVRPAGPEYSKGTWTCPNCGAEVDSKYIFCTSCGYKRGG